MKLIIAGGRNVANAASVIKTYMDGEPEVKISDIKEIVSGTARGADVGGELWATDENIVITSFPAEWNKYGRSAGHIRNKQMAEYADALLLIWDGQSRGSANMKANMEKLGKPVYEVIVGLKNVAEKC